MTTPERVDRAPVTGLTIDGPVELDYTDLPGFTLLTMAADGDAKAMDTLLARGEKPK